MWSDLDRPPLAGVRGKPVRVHGGWRVRVVASTASTIADVIAAARAGEAPGYVLVAEQQTAGRGRLDRSWISPARAGLTFSALLTAAPSSWVPLLGGVAVAQAITDVCGLPATLKWPNDVLVGEHKVAGVLAEVAAAPHGPRVVLGIGINVTTTREELPPDFRATSLRLAGAEVTDRLTLLRAILHELAQGATPNDYRSSCATLGREVAVHLPDGTVASGVAEQVDEGGRLVVAGRAYAAGDVVHLR